MGVHEVWLLPSGELGLRTFTPGGEPDRWLRLPPGTDLHHAVRLCKAEGQPIHEE